MTDGTGATVDDDRGSDAAETDASATDADADAGYGGVFGAYPYAFRRSPSRLFRSYAVLGGLVTVLSIIVFTSALVQVIANTAGTAGGSFTFVRAFYIVVGFLVIAPLMAPVLLVARRHRRVGSTPVYDRALAGAGYLFLFSLYVALVVMAPPGLRETPPAVIAPAVETLYGLPQVMGAVPPLIALAVGYLLHRRYR